MLERKVSSKSARSIFFEDYNDIDIYVEDEKEGYKKIYKELLNKIFNEQLRVQHILPIGCRNHVLDECEKNQATGGRKRLYIIDGDLFLINNNDVRAVGLKGLFVLPRYCIENYFIDESALIEVTYKIDSELERDEIKSKLDFENWVSSNEKKLIDLFIIYALCNKHAIKGTVSFKVYDLYSDERGDISSIKNSARIEELSQKLISQIGIDSFIIQKKEIEDRIANEKNKLLKYVSGKNYLLPIFFDKLKTITRSNVDGLFVKLMLSSYCDVSELYNIKNYIIE